MSSSGAHSGRTRRDCVTDRSRAATPPQHRCLPPGLCQPEWASGLCTSWSAFLAALLQMICPCLKTLSLTPAPALCQDPTLGFCWQTTKKLKFAIHSETRHKGAPGCGGPDLRYSVVTAAPKQSWPQDLTLMTRSTKPLSSSLETGV